MNRIAAFEKVSFEQYKKDVVSSGRWGISDEVLRQEWENIKLPQRATKGSAGYDFYMPYETAIGENPIIIPTGIRCRISDGWVLTLFPKSGLGFKYRMTFDNTIPVIDNDYYGSDNEGHIKMKLRNEVPMLMKAGQKYMQGIFLPFGITEDDAADGIRNGGMGSTGDM